MEDQAFLIYILYFNDINEDRLNNVKEIFCEDKYNLNITQEDFLEKEYAIGTFGDTKFDLIVANPPYALMDDDGKRTSKNHNLIPYHLQVAPYSLHLLFYQ